jgi:hypothetical protein
MTTRRLGLVGLILAAACVIAGTNAGAQTADTESGALKPPPPLQPPVRIPPVFTPPLITPPARPVPRAAPPQGEPAPQTGESKRADAKQREFHDLLRKTQAEIATRRGEARRTAQAEADAGAKAQWDNYARLLDAAERRVNDKLTAVARGGALSDPGALAVKYAGIEVPGAPAAPVRTATGLGSVNALCAGVLTASADATDPAVVCACGEKYLARLGDDARQLRQRADRLVGRTYNWVPAQRYTAQDIDDAFKDAKLLQAYTARRRVAACSVWAVDRAKVGGLLKDRDRLRGEIAALTTDADRVWQKERVLIGQLDARVAGNDALKKQIEELGRQQRDLATKASGLRNKDLMDVLGRLALFDEDVPLAKSGTYSEVQSAVKTLWGLYRLEVDHELGAAHAEFMSYNYASADDSYDKFLRKWYGMWIQRPESERGVPSFRDMPGYLNEAIALCRRRASEYTQKAVVMVRALPPLAERLRTTHRSLSEDLARWGQISAYDAWPSVEDSSTAVAFEQFSRVLFADNERLALSVDVPFVTSEGGYLGRSGLPRECLGWNGAFADGSIGRGFDVYDAFKRDYERTRVGGRVEDARIEAPYPEKYLGFEVRPFKDRATGSDVMYASGADEQERP